MTTATIIPGLTNSPPSRANIAAFPTGVDQFLQDLPSIVTAENQVIQELNTWATEVETFKNQAATSETNSATSASTALTQARNAAASMVSLWASGTTYTAGQIVYSNVDAREYKRKTTGAGTTDPSSDTSNWEPLGWEYITNYPEIRPTLDLNFAGSQTVDPRITFTRNSTATYFDKFGVMQTAGVNQPRIDFDPVTGECRGLLVEEQRTNLLAYSAQFDNAAWSRIGTNVTANAAVAPDGTVTADHITFSGAVNDRLDYVTSIAAAPGATYTYSVWLKGAGTVNIALNTTSGVGGEVDTVLTLTGDWTRHSASVTYGTGVTGNVRVHGVIDRSGITPSVYAWGAQLEAGAFPTSYIPTTTAQVTRAADSAVMTGTNFSSWYRQDEGTLYEEGSTLKPNTDPNAKFTSSITDGSSNFITGLRYTTAVAPRVDHAGVTQANLVTLVPHQNDAFHRNAIAVKQNDFAASTNGLAVVSDSSGSLPMTMNTLSIGRYGITYLCGHIKKIAYYPKRLSNAQLQYITKS